MVGTHGSQPQLHYVRIAIKVDVRGAGGGDAVEARKLQDEIVEAGDRLPAELRDHLHGRSVRGLDEPGEIARPLLLGPAFGGQQQGRAEAPPLEPGQDARITGVAGYAA